MSSAPASSYPLHNMTNIPVELLLIPLCLTALVSTEIDNYVPDLGTKHSSVQYSVFKSPAAPWHAKDFSRSPVIRRFSMYQEFRRLTGVVIMAENPWDEVFVKEPAGGGCRSKASSTVRDTAALHGCHLAVSAGFFNTSDGACIGNVVTNSSVIQTSSNLNAHFGLLRTGEMFMGYPNVSCIDDFKELVVGALWIVRDGKPNWEHSAQMEEVSVQQTGSWKDFMAVVSARASIGWDKRGRIILAAVDGKTGKDGTNIPGIARVMMHFGAVEAINLDGGGSMTVVADGMVFNAPSDAKPDENDEPWIYMTAERLVTSIMCFKRR